MICHLKIRGKVLWHFARVLFVANAPLRRAILPTIMWDAFCKNNGFRINVHVFISHEIDPYFEIKEHRLQNSFTLTSWLRRITISYHFGFWIPEHDFPHVFIPFFIDCQQVESSKNVPELQKKIYTDFESFSHCKTTHHLMRIRKRGEGSWGICLRFYFEIMR